MQIIRKLIQIFKPKMQEEPCFPEHCNTCTFKERCNTDIDQKWEEYKLEMAQNDHIQAKRHPVRKLMLQERKEAYEDNFDNLIGGCQAEYLGVCVEGEKHDYDINDPICRKCYLCPQITNLNNAYPNLTLLNQ